MSRFSDLFAALGGGVLAIIAVVLFFIVYVVCVAAIWAGIIYLVLIFLKALGLDVGLV